MAYLFGAAGVAPMIPGGFLTFANAPLYRSDEIAHRVGLDVLDNQQLAAPIIWAVIAVIWIRWANGERAADVASARPAGHDAPTTGTA